MRKQANFRLPQITIDQIGNLVDLCNAESQAHVIMVAIDRLYQAETAQDKTYTIHANEDTHEDIRRTTSPNTRGQAIMAYLLWYYSPESEDDNGDTVDFLDWMKKNTFGKWPDIEV